MKVILEIKVEPKKDDLIIFDGKEWTTINKRFLVKHIEEFVKKSLEEQNEKFDRTIKQVDKKLESYHRILQNITKGE